jgi:hypothetical protein
LGRIGGCIDELEGLGEWDAVVVIGDIPLLLELLLLLNCKATGEGDEGCNNDLFDLEEKPFWKLDGSHCMACCSWDVNS